MAADKLEQRPSRQRHKDSAALASSSPRKRRYKTPGGFPCSGTRKHLKQSLGKRRFYVKLTPPPPPKPLLFKNSNSTAYTGEKDALNSTIKSEFNSAPTA